MNILKSRKILASADVDAYDYWEEKFNAWQPYALRSGTGLRPYPSHRWRGGPLPLTQPRAATPSAGHRVAEAGER